LKGLLRCVTYTKKQAQERFIQTLLRTTKKPTQLSQAGELSVDDKGQYWNRVYKIGMAKSESDMGGALAIRVCDEGRYDEACATPDDHHVHLSFDNGNGM
jgi:hypothetical protein